MGDTYDTGHGLPSEFPSDPSYTLYIFVGGLLSVLLIALVAAAIIGFLNGHASRRRLDFEDWPTRMAGFIKKKADDVVRGKAGGHAEPAPIEGLWGAFFGGGGAREAHERRNVRDIDMARAGVAASRVRSLIGNNLKLGKEVAAELKHLNEALEGYKEIKDAAPVPGAAAAGSTIINIAVNNGVPGAAGGEAAPALAGPYAQPASVVQAVPQMFEARPLDKDANVWFAFNKFRDDWSRPDVMAAQLKAAQAALCTRPPEPPRPA